MALQGTASVRVENLKRGEVWFVRLGRTAGAETWTLTPCLILQMDEINKSGMFETVLVVPLTTQVPPEDKRIEFDVLLPADETGLARETIALWPLVRAVTPERFQNRTGQVAPERLDPITRFIAQLMGYNP
jgi:mRNA interferase MazF